MITSSAECRERMVPGGGVLAAFQQNVFQGPYFGVMLKIVTVTKKHLAHRR